MTAPEKHPQHAGLDELRRRLDKAGSIKQVLSVYQRILETAEELRSNPELRNQAAELKLQAQRKMGRLLAAHHLRGGDRKSSRAPQRLHLTDLGISNNQSARWQQEAAVPEAIFGQYCRDMEARGREPTSRGLVTRDRELVFSLISGRLRAMSRDGQRFPCIHAAPPWPGEHDRECDPSAAVDEMARCLYELPVNDISAGCGTSLPVDHSGIPSASHVCTCGMGLSVRVASPLQGGGCRPRCFLGARLRAFAPRSPRKSTLRGVHRAGLVGRANYFRFRSFAGIPRTNRARKSAALS